MLSKLDDAESGGCVLKAVRFVHGKDWHRSYILVTMYLLIKNVLWRNKMIILFHIGPLMMLFLRKFGFRNNVRSYCILSHPIITLSSFHEHSVINIYFILPTKI